MAGLAQIGFATPWLLWALVVLPVLWMLLRAVPPAPLRRLFPGVVLLLGLKDDDAVTDKTPWWLILLRMLAAAAVIVGLAGPVLNPDAEGQARSGPVLLLLDGGWAGAGDWEARLDLADRLLADADRAGRTAAVLQLSAPEPSNFQPAGDLRAHLPGLQPLAWEPTAAGIEDALAILQDIHGGFDTIWMSDGLEFAGHDRLVAALQERGQIRVFEDDLGAVALLPPVFEDGEIHLTAVRNRGQGAMALELRAHGRDPTGVERVLATLPVQIEAGAKSAEARLSLPAELRARISRFDILGQRSAGAVVLSDDSLQRREVALITERDDREGLELLSPLHYLHQALLPSADLLQGSLSDILPANPDAIILADIAGLPEAEEKALREWVNQGGMLLRFAGPHLAASDLSRSEEHPLMPVRLRSGGRTVGGAMSWGEPKTLAPFADTSPFYGLAIPEDVTVSAQVMAQPDPSLAERVIAQLSDGTPLVTRKTLGQGKVVLFHVSANAEWSSLPLSGLFMRMLDRLAVSSVTSQPDAEDLAGSVWQPLRVLDGFGRLQDAGNLIGVAGEDLIQAPLSRDLQPGLYQGEARLIARNVMTADRELTATTWPASVSVVGLDRPEQVPLAGYLLALAVLILLADVIATLALSGRILLRGGKAVVPVLLLALGPGLIALAPSGAGAQDTQEDRHVLSATSEVVLAYVLTGNARVDDVSRAGLTGLSDTLFFRTSVEPDLPIGVDLERDELAFYPLLYWPITEDQPVPTVDAYERLNRYLRTGGMIVFDTRDADIAGFGTASPNGRKLRQLAEPLAIPPLEPLPGDHVLTRTFYLLQDFPGRFSGRDIWVEAAPPGAEKVDGMPFRNLNDGVTPVVIGGNDWAAAWATDPQGNPLYPVGRGYSGERQRELAYRFGVNLVMHVLTGNYKSDQVHVPALLDRLGQ
ncbi:hypothetical protein TG4357_00546 [Thalassovita gelatinovora]|uniref:N-terminal double-transmembrane domain protein n=1 Tax=Thalassovita gelatinovora TaxID=53501 RepID=A0A0P1FPM5_THAGE|nr:DUF4159 domain-containing protein [Thalassovita gelatinovora]CUH63224.1 hypothetical protein TG4357_00546 [Thalassovita gelatinovora]SEQ63697.1 N-terminal double-transmembrane domain-containing protein [Thalassovita gelatinovora]